MYFKAIPQIPYDSNNDGTFKFVTNLLRRVKVREDAITNAGVFDTYDVKDGETPEMIAHKLYGDSNLHWLILYVNNITDRYHQWPMSTIQFEEYVSEKYSNPDGIHHYEINQTSGDTTEVVEVYNPDLLTDAGASSDADAQAGATSVTNREYEDRLQNNKRKIRLLDSNFVIQAINEYQRLMSSSTL